MTKFVSWNVNGLRAARTKGFDQVVTGLDADFFCVQETKLQEGQIDPDFIPGYHSFWNYAEKKGYSGVAILGRQEPLDVIRQIGHEGDSEGRALAIELPEYYLVNVYAPNSQPELRRIEFRMSWEDSFREFLHGLDQKKPVIVCGDFNVAHHDIDLRNPDEFRGSTGFSEPERGKLEQLLGAGFIDTYRALHPTEEKVYTWWSYMARERQRNIGWRIDYFLISERLRPRLEDASVYRHILGSDHCPISITLS
ncbi:MAG: exodeoxyribonuclease III [Bacteroidales bacterium]|nr:exodeoxyribonuclease III [Bacteroidales bacterium]MCD8393953.1 exodeoxyribonuclease III [Bacteroidales bacterium]